MTTMRPETKRGRGFRLRCSICWRLFSPLFGAALALGAACSGEDDEAGECTGGDGAVAGAEDTTHCREADGTPIVQSIGECSTSVEAPAEEEPAEGEEHTDGEEEHEHGVFDGREADDDTCKYRVRFENTCVLLNEPVTFTLSLTRKLDGERATGGDPSPEIYFASEETHISPSNDIGAEEISPGVYEIGPVIFDRPGRWVVRFHYFGTCSEIPEDSPHGHVAFNFDVPEP